LAESDIQKVQQTAEQTHKWLEEKRAALAGTPRTQNPPITVAQIRQEKQVRAEQQLLTKGIMVAVCATFSAFSPCNWFVFRMILRITGSTQPHDYN
jgi:hypothetical protein